MPGHSPGGNAGYPYPTSEQFPAISEAPDPGFVVGVIDTGISLHGEAPHPYLARNLAAGWPKQPHVIEVSGGKAGPTDGHGTFLSGLILREAPFATLAVNSSCAGDPHLNEVRIGRAIEGFAAMPDLRVLNMTFYSKDPDELTPAPILSALEGLLTANRDVVVVTAVANDWSPTRTFPAAHSAALNRRFGHRVVVVSAVDETIRNWYGYDAWVPPPKASFANFGDVDVWASGVRVLGPHLFAPTGSGETPTYPHTGWARWSGCSFAGATVAGLLAHALHADSSLTGAEALARITAGRPRIPIAGVMPQNWRPYVQGVESTWPPYTTRPAPAGGDGPYRA